MIIKNESLLKEFRGPGSCDYCGRYCQSREAAHIFARGMGGGGRLDIRCNLMALGSAFDCGCHNNHHNGHEPTRDDLLAMVAKREKCLQEDVKRAITFFQRLPKEARIQFDIEINIRSVFLHRASMRAVALIDKEWETYLEANKRKRVPRSGS